MKPENPERLWVTCASDGVAIETRGYDNKRDADAYRDGLHSHRNAHAFTPVAEYIRADIAAAREAAAEAKYKNRDVEVMRVALADLRRIRACFVARANSLRTIGEESRAMGLEDAVKQLDEEVFT